MDSGAQDSDFGDKIAMTIPYREWWDFHVITLEGHETGGFAGWVTPDDWTNVYRDYGIIGQYRVIATDQWIWYTILKPSASDFALIAGADMPANFRFDFRVIKDSWAAGVPCTIALVEMMSMLNNAAPGAAWLPDKATGRYTDGVSVDWDNYPINEGYGFAGCQFCRPYNDPPLNLAYRDVLRSEVVDSPMPPPLLIESEIASNFAASEACEIREELFRNGIQVKIDAFKDGGGWCNLDDGEKITLNVFPERFRIKYFNPVVNSLSRYKIPIGGGVDLVINGIGFDNNPDEINDLCGVNADAQWGAELTVSTIKFYTIGGILAGIITTPMAEFTVDSDTQITIPVATMNALGLAKGAYNILLSKGVITDCGTTEAYAGDWTCDADGRMRESARMIFMVGEVAFSTAKKKKPIILTHWVWKAKDGSTVDKYYSPIDTRCRSVSTFYDGRILSCSPVTRAIDDRTGLYSVSDMNIELANHDMEFSKMLSKYFLKNQLVEIFHAWCDEPEAWKRSVFQGVVVDYSLKGTSFFVTIRDVTQKYFKMKVPPEVCT